MSHTVVSVDFTTTRLRGLPSEEAPVLCSCGWRGVVPGFYYHRKEVGAAPAQLSHSKRQAFRIDPRRVS